MKSSYAQKIMDAPDAPRVIELLVEAMDAEKRRRDDFRESLNPHTKAEFINGHVVIHSPVKSQHWKITDLLSRIVSTYTGLHRLGRVGVEKVMIALERNDYEPDLVFFSAQKAAHFTDNQVLFPAPDFVVEILSKKTAAKDKDIKKRDYAANGIAEYWIIDPNQQQIEQYILHNHSTDSQYPAPTIRGIGDRIESHAIPGFNIPVSAIFDETSNIETLQGFLTFRRPV